MSKGSSCAAAVRALEGAVFSQGAALLGAACGAWLLAGAVPGPYTPCLARDCQHRPRNAGTSWGAGAAALPRPSWVSPGRPVWHPVPPVPPFPCLQSGEGSRAACGDPKATSVKSGCCIFGVEAHSTEELELCTQSRRPGNRQTALSLLTV